MKNQAAQALGKLGGLSRSKAKSKASRFNGLKGGRPKVLSETTDSFGIPFIEIEGFKDDFIMEMANLYERRTGVPYMIHIRTQEETPSHPETASLKIYEDDPKSLNFSVSISKDPQVIQNTMNHKFFKSLKSRDLKKIFKWIQINYKDLHWYYFDGPQWTRDERDDLEKRLYRLDQKMDPNQFRVGKMEYDSIQQFRKEAGIKTNDLNNWIEDQFHKSLMMLTKEEYEKVIEYLENKKGITK